MARQLSADTEYVYRWLWQWPWASAADIVRVTGLKAPAVSNALNRGETKLGWFVSARLGRVAPVPTRYVVTNKGVEELQERFGWEPFWWHTADGVRALARRLEVLEMAYNYLPLLWQSNMLTVPNCHVFREWEEIAWQTGEPVTRVELVETDWSNGRLVHFHWLKDGPFEAVATYHNGNPDHDFLRIPILWRGSFQKPADIARVRRDMENVLVEDERWGKLPMEQALGDYYPGMVIFCPDRVAAAVVQRNWLQSFTSRAVGAMPAIIDAQGQVVRAMNPPVSRWSTYRLSPGAGPLKDIKGAVDSLGMRAYPTINGTRAFRAFRAIDGSPGVTLEQISASMGVDEKDVRALLEPMVGAHVITVQANGHYLDVSGRGLLADSQRTSRSGVKRRWGVYQEPGGEYTRAQRLHNQGQLAAILALRRHGFPAFPTMGIVIEASYWASNQWRTIRVTPDGCVLLPPGVVAFLEYERSAQTPKALEKKARNYRRFAELGLHVPVLFITDSAVPRKLSAEKAAKQSRENSIASAKILAALRCPMLLAADMDSVQAGPHGKAVIQDGALVGGADSGCWWYWYRDRDAPSSTAPIDLGAQIYVQDPERMGWRVPLDRPFRVV